MAAIENRGAGRSNEERIEYDMVAKIAGYFGYKSGDETALRTACCDGWWIGVQAHGSRSGPSESDQSEKKINEVQDCIPFRWILFTQE